MKKLLFSAAIIAAMLLTAAGQEASAQSRRPANTNQPQVERKMMAPSKQEMTQPQTTRVEEKKEEEVVIKPGKYKVPANSPQNVTNTTKPSAKSQLVQDGVGVSRDKSVAKTIEQSSIGNIENLTNEEVTQRCNAILSDANASEALKTRAKSILSKNQLPNH